MNQKIYDSHIHSHNSHDGRNSVEDICREAVKRGLAGITFTDHCDAASGTSECVQVKEGVIADVRRAREEFGDRLAIYAGIELGEPHHDPDLAREVADGNELDFVIGSLHCLRGSVDFYYIDFDSTDLNSLMPQYYDELEEMASLGCFDVFGHLNYQLRYMSDGARRKFDIAAWYERLGEVLKAIAKSGKGIEINTSGLRRKGLADTLPSIEVVRMFALSGGEIVTIGSDSHFSSTVGAGVAAAMERMLGAGLRRFATFEKRTPVMRDIE